MGFEQGKQKYAGQNIVILGMAKSGAAVARLLAGFGARVTVNDSKQREECGEEVAAGLEQLRITVICGSHPDDVINSEVDLVVKNPGIPYHIPPVQKAIQLGIPMITEVEVAWQISDAPFIGITGSNGKTTTTTLVGEILAAADRHPVVAGNIGTVLCKKAVQAKNHEILVAELSSFQLKGTRDFSPKIACILNIYEAHQDYHGGMEDYIRSKMNLFLQQKPGDITILNRDCPVLSGLASQVPAQLMWFSRTQEVEWGTFVRESKLFYRDQKGKEHFIIDIPRIGIPGGHNLENVLAAAAIACAAGVPASVIGRVVAAFRGVEHRLEFVAEMNGVNYYNDSKATNPRATIQGLLAFEQPVILIAGGLDRGIDFHELVPLLAEKVKILVTYGQTAHILQKAGQQAGIDQSITVHNVKEAVIHASRMATEGDIVLLSPACASWDMHRSFEERGSIFKEAVHNLKTSLQ